MPTPSEVAIREAEPKPIAVIRQALEVRAADLMAVLPPGMNAERFTRVALLAISKNPDLLACTPSSIVRAIIEAAEVGLEPTGSLSRAWLVPFRPYKDATPEATLIIGYQGLQDLARDSGKITAIWSRVVWEGDEFEEVEGSERKLAHRPAHLTEDPTKLKFVYAVAQYTDGTLVWEVMSKAQVDAIRAGSRGRNSKGWVEGYPQMARKSAVRRLANSLPLTPRAILAISRDDENEFGAPGVTEPVVTKASQVRDRLAARNPRKRSTRPTDAPSASEAPEDADTGSDAPSVSANPQTAICGATSDPALGDIEVCVKGPDHEGVHESEGGSRWPR